MSARKLAASPRNVFKYTFRINRRVSSIHHHPAMKRLCSSKTWSSYGSLPLIPDLTNPPHYDPYLLAPLQLTPPNPDPTQMARVVSLALALALGMSVLG